MRKLVSLIVVLSFISSAQSQEKIIKYFDGDWMETTAQKATYYAHFVKRDTGYDVTTYWKRTNLLRGIGSYTDTLLMDPVGLNILYYKNGNIEDSSFIVDGKYKYAFHYNESKKLVVRFYTPEGSTETVKEAFDDDGKKIKPFVLFKEAEFKSGQAAWEKYISRKGSSDLDVKGPVPAIATVLVQFVVDEDGVVTNAKVIRSSGVKEADKDALQTISGSPAWKPAIRYNEPVRRVMVQAVTYKGVE